MNAITLLDKTADYLCWELWLSWMFQSYITHQPPQTTKNSAKASSSSSLLSTLNSTSSWLSLSMNTSLGCKNNVFEINASSKGHLNSQVTAGEILLGSWYLDICETWHFVGELILGYMCNVTALMCFEWLNVSFCSNIIFIYWLISISSNDWWIIEWNNLCNHYQLSENNQINQWMNLLLHSY